MGIIAWVDFWDCGQAHYARERPRRNGVYDLHWHRRSIAWWYD